MKIEPRDRFFPRRGLKKSGQFLIIGPGANGMKQALVLFSGGIDSTTALYWARNRYDSVRALTFDYGQRHRVEIRMARATARKLGIGHEIFPIRLDRIGDSALTDLSIPLPRPRRVEEIGPGVPATYVPFRNGIFLAVAAALAEARGIRDIVCGFNVIDSPHYPDTRPAFVKAMEKAVRSGTKPVSGCGRLRILAPFAEMKKSEIIRRGLSLRADYARSVSCYAGGEIPCRRCSSCLLRQRAWREVGRPDPLIVRLAKEGRL
jgi:7-cyano-7-deazaguanine synthase